MGEPLPEISGLGYQKIGSLITKVVYGDCRVDASRPQSFANLLGNVYDSPEDAVTELPEALIKFDERAAAEVRDLLSNYDPDAGWCFGLPHPAADGYDSWIDGRGDRPDPVGQTATTG